MDYRFTYEEFKDMFKHRFSRHINLKFLHKVGTIVRKKEPLSRERLQKIHRMLNQLTREISQELKFGDSDSNDDSASFGESTGILVSNRGY